MRSILFGILALLALIVVSALGAQLFVPLHRAGLGLQVILPAAYAQGGGKGQGNVPQAQAGHRQPAVQDVQGVQKGSSADRAVKKADDNLKKKLGGICRGC
jgi:hypothetical protein